MATEIAMPQLGLTMEAGTVRRWLKQPGDAVRKDEPLMEIETDKATMEVTSDAEGVFLSIAVAEGNQVPVGTVLGWIGQRNEAVPPVPGATPTPTPTPTATATPTPTATATATPATGPNRPRASPAARARARAHGIALGEIRGTGPHGRIQVRDVEAHAAACAAAPAPAAPAPAPARPVAPPPLQARAAAPAAFRDVPVAGLRKVISERMAQSFHGTVPVLLTAEATMDRADELLARVGPALAERAGGKVGYLPLVVKAVAAALVKHPAANAHWLGPVIRVFEGAVNVGVAVAREDGLVVPVLRDAHALGLGDAAAGIANLAARARAGALTLPEMEGGTFTVSNLGNHAIGHFMPVINPPQVAILGVGRAVPRPVVRDGQVQILPVLPLSLVFDHRAIDGDPAAAVLDAIKANLEEPYRLLV